MSSPKLGECRLLRIPRNLTAISEALEARGHPWGSARNFVFQGSKL